ncbi:MAG: hypothetical protein HPY50_03445 [Firmicutes bacterium]|nr:hypothetical protein [Bacillota bacterium]
MATSKPTAETPPELLSIEELKRRNRTPDRVFEGMKAAENWKTGKSVTQADYEKALKGFLESPMGGKKVKQDAKGR